MSGAPPGLTMTASPATLVPGSGSSHVTLSASSSTHVGTFNSAVGLSVSGLPNGVTASLTPSSIGAPGDGSSTLAFQASATATPDTYNVTARGSGGGISKLQTESLTVLQAPGFKLALSASSFTVYQGLRESSTRQLRIWAASVRR